MSLTYKIASTIVRLIGVKKMFLKNKEEMLEYAKGENAKIVFDLEKAKKRAERKNYYLYDRDVMGYRLISYQKNQIPSEGAVLYLFGGGMITQPDKLDFAFSERIMQQTGKDVWFLFYPLCSENVKIDKTYEVSFEAYRLMTESYKAENISVLGFSSGACLSLGIFLHNNAIGRPLPMPGKIISVSPGGIPDVTVDENKEIWEKLKELNHKDVMIDPTYIKTAMEKYHVPYEIIVGKKMCHCYPLVRFFKEGREAQDEIIELLGQ